MSNPRALRPWQCALLLILASLGALADEDNNYRLAGIVAVSPERLLAVIEMPDGRQGLFHSGDALAGGHITNVTRTEVHVVRGASELVLSLRGNPKLAAAAAPIASDEITADEPGGDATVRNQPLFYEDTVRLLTSVARASVHDKPGSAAAPTSATGAAVEALSARLDELLGVPAGGRIVAVDGAPVGSPQEVIDKVVPLLGLGRAVRLNLTGAGDLQVMYLTPVEEQ
jgi:hypothetical protein